LDNKEALNLLLHGILGVLGPLVDILFYTLHLLLYINISDSAMYIIKAVTGKIKILFNTLLVAVFLLYSYSSIAANYFSDKYDIQDIDVCSSLASCFFYTFTFGLRNGGGIGDSMNPYKYGQDGKFGSKLIYDVTFFMFINIIILNIVFGVIIDTFGDMRDEAYKRNEIISRKCLVCLNEKQAIEEFGYNFNYHTNNYHNIWVYAEYIWYVSS
jgi:Ion transport protein